MILLSCAGSNANTTHYIESVGGVEAGDHLLMDSGTEYHGYSSDITRTWSDRISRIGTLGTASMILLSCAGNNAITNDYIESVGGVEVGDLLLMDARTEYHGYSRKCLNDSSFLCRQ